ncbi:MAG TPA: hypothetical protein VEL07_13520 [Planctomycetota bacterium]|nr:hypothetical protein [Planctomycetota bacterium]
MTGRRAFTLVELLISVALGLVIVFVAFAGVRVAAQSISVVNRLALENEVLREGYLMANDQVDTWTWHDDPTAPPTERPLRQVASDGRGLAFTPLRDTWTYVADSDRERQRGWDAENPWSPADPACWWRGDMAEKAYGTMRHGRYALFAHVDAANGPVDIDSPAGSYGSGIPVARSWLYGQTKGLLHGLGFYGACDYLTGNAVYGWYDRWQDGATTDGGIPRWLVAPNWNSSAFTNGDGDQATVRGLYRLTFVTQFGLVSPTVGTTGDQLAAQDRRWWGLFGPSDFDTWKSATGTGRSLMRLRPAHWPEASVSINRAIKNRRFIAMSFVRLASPLTGQVMEFTFSAFGTSLRGARQQRRPDDGWARWDNAAGFANDPTLDSP